METVIVPIVKNARENISSKYHKMKYHSQKNFTDSYQFHQSLVPVLIGDIVRDDETRNDRTPVLGLSAFTLFLMMSPTGDNLYDATTDWWSWQESVKAFL